MKPIWLLILLLVPAEQAQAGRNFIASGASEEFCRHIEAQAESHRQRHAIAWLGQPLPGDWSRPCPIRIVMGVRQGGATSFAFHDGEVGGWDMMVSGDAQEIITRVLPHEVLHSVFASHFRRRLPRWADEGACTTVEHPDERRRADQMLRGIFREGRALPIGELLTLQEYPADVMPLYWQGHSIVSYLLTLADRRTFVRFLDTAFRTGKYSEALETVYSIPGPQGLEAKWRVWLNERTPENPQQVAMAQLPRICGPGQRCDPRPQPQQNPSGGSPPADGGTYDPYPGFAEPRPQLPQTLPPWNNFQQGAQNPPNQPPVVPAPAITSVTPDPEPPTDSTPAPSAPTAGPLANVPLAADRAATSETGEYRAPYRGEGDQAGRQNAGGWFSKLGQTFGGGLGTAAGVIATAVLAGMGIPPVVSRIGGALAGRAVKRAESKVAGDLGPALEAQFSRLSHDVEQKLAGFGQHLGQAGAEQRFAKLSGGLLQQIDARLADLSQRAKAEPITIPIITPPEVQHSNTFVGVPDNREGKAYQEAIGRMTDYDWRLKDTFRELNRVKNLILSSQEPTT